MQTLCIICTLLFTLGVNCNADAWWYLNGRTIIGTGSVDLLPNVYGFGTVIVRDGLDYCVDVREAPAPGQMLTWTIRVDGDRLAWTQSAIHNTAGNVQYRLMCNQTSVLLNDTPTGSITLDGGQYATVTACAPGLATLPECPSWLALCLGCVTAIWRKR